MDLLLALFFPAGVALLAALARRIRGRRATEKPYGERLAELAGELTRASREVDSVLAELVMTGKSREAAVNDLEAELAVLAGRESEARQRIESLEKTPLPVAEHLAKLLRPGERRSARRDWLFFVAGMVLNALTSFVLQSIRAAK